MNFIFSFILYVIFILPSFASATCSSNSSNTSNCSAGCYLYSVTQTCKECQAGFWNDGNYSTCQSCNFPSDSHKTTPPMSSSCDNWICEAGYYKSGDTCVNASGCNLGEGQYLPQNSTSCNDWVCDTNYYMNSDNSGCTHCPANSESASGSNNIEDCNCTTGYYKSDDEQSCIQCPTTSRQVFSDTDHIDECSCNATDTYLIHYTINETEYYYCGTCGDGTPNPNNTGSGVHTCICDTGANKTNNQSGFCQCPTRGNTPIKTNFLTNVSGTQTRGGNNSAGQCDCNSGNVKNYHLVQNDDELWVCSRCPGDSQTDANDHKICNCATGAIAAYEESVLKSCNCSFNTQHNSTNNECECKQGFPKYFTDDDNVLHCSQCGSSNAKYYTNGNLCKCNKGYFGDGDTCTMCPYGSTTSGEGATGKNNCYMDNETRFCIPYNNAYRCFNLLPNNVTIHGPNASSN